MTIFSRYLAFCHKGQNLLSRYNALRPFCANEGLLNQLDNCSRMITITFVRSITELDLDETFASFYDEIIDENNLSLIVELYNDFSHIIKPKYESYPDKRIFADDFVLLEINIARMDLLIRDLEDELVPQITLVI